ncbi:MAG: glucokinase [Vicinamibacterales bacterium]
MILAGDIGGTSTRLGLFDVGNGRPSPRHVASFTTLDYPGLTAIIAAFARDAAVRGTEVTAACFGVAGPVIDGAAQLTNVPWLVRGRDVAEAFDIARVALLNDLQAMAHAVPVLEEDELHPLQQGVRLAGGNMALVAAGTGLGQALLHNIDRRFVPCPSEGGHADFAARTEREIVVLRELTQRYGRAEVEHVVSGPGLLNLFAITHTAPCLAIEAPDSPEAPAAITAAALERRCRGCIDALDVFVDAYGAEAGNLALRAMATAGLFIGGGIAPKILPALEDGRFMRAFLDKGAMRPLLSRIPVHVILNKDAGLLGAAVHAETLVA